MAFLDYDGLTHFKEKNDAAYVKVYNNAGAHNAIYRGKNLGTAVTDAQYAAIAAGTFEDLYIGDYWYISGVYWRIAAFDYYLNIGPDGGPSCTTHHVTIVGDSGGGAGPMNATDTTQGGYANSSGRTTGLTTAKTVINSAFGEAHILTYKNILNNSVSNGMQTGAAWYDCTVELMTEQNVYGASYYSQKSNGTSFAFLMRADNTQFPLFALNHSLISSKGDGNRIWYWLRDVASATQFSLVDGQGTPSYYIASGTGVYRPAFSIIG